MQQHLNQQTKSLRGCQIKLVYYEAYLNKNSALQREQSLKNNRRMREFLLKRVRRSLEE